jgi:ATP-dependent RNA helicase SUPV3L1/SUV3
LSDALHEALLRRFVDKRSATLVRAMEDGQELLAGVKACGEVVVEGEHIGHLDGFRFIPDESAKGSDYVAVMKVARQALKTEIKRRASQMMKADDTQFQLAEDGTVLYQASVNNPVPGKPVATIKTGSTILSPVVDLLDSDLITDQDKAAVQERLDTWLKKHIDETLLNLAPLENPDDVSGAARGIAFQLFEAFGVLPRESVEDLIASLEQEDRAALRSLYVRMGPVFIYLPSLMKPAAIRLKAALWSLWHEKPLPAEVPADGITSFSVADKSVDKDYLQVLGYPVYGNRAIRLDMLDRLVIAIYDSAKEGTFRAEHKMAE